MLSPVVLDALLEDPGCEEVVSGLEHGLAPAYEDHAHEDIEEALEATEEEEEAGAGADAAPAERLLEVLPGRRGGERGGERPGFRIMEPGGRMADGSTRSN